MIGMSRVANQRQPVQPRHHQILQDDRRLDQLGLMDGLMRIGAKMEIDVVLIGQPTPHGFADHGLIVDQQHHRGVLVGRLHVIQLQVMH
jgi:hypothetical protein